MKFLKTSSFFCVTFIAFILLVSWLLSMTLEHFSGHHNIFYPGKQDTIPSKHILEDSEQIGDKFENVYTFVQISDIHISKFRLVSEIIPQLKSLCKEYLPLIQPKVVLVTGDITDAKAKDNLKSEQYIEEWRSYNELVSYCQKHVDTTWLDVRGNHDDFAVQSKDSPNNFYRKFGSSGRLFGNSSSFQFVLKLPFGKYSFNGIDLAPEPGPRRPFNFFGVVSQQDIDKIAAIGESSKRCNMSFWFGHYPLSVINAPSKVRHIIQTGVAYLCGHLHTLGGLVPRMYARPVEGHLELEAGDWKENRRYRIMAVDHDIFSFVDATFGEMPVVLVTNPKDARFVAPSHESVEGIIKSTHIRFFVFSKVQPSTVSVYIDNQPICKNAKHSGPSFYVCPWKPKEHASGLHEILISVTDSLQGESTFRFPFALDDSIPLLDMIPAFIMLANFCVLAKMMFCMTWFVTVLLPLYIRRKESTTSRGSFRRIIMSFVPYQIISFSSKDHVFWPLFYYNCYLVIGPLFVGELVPGSIGFCFVHGIFTNGNWIPGSLTYIYATLQIVTFSIPMMLWLGDTNSSNRTRKIICSIMNTSFVALGILFQIYFCRTIYICYGVIAFVVSPSAMGAVLLGGWLAYKDYAHTQRKNTVVSS